MPAGTQQRPCRAWLLLLLASCLLAPAAADQRAESVGWQPAAKAGVKQPSSSAKAAAVHPALLRQHPAVFTLADLGIWSTSLMGKVPLAASAAAWVHDLGHYVPPAARKVAGAMSASLEAAAALPHPGAAVMQLRHWWRLRCDDSADTMDLRGVGTAASAAVRRVVRRVTVCPRCCTPPCLAAEVLVHP
jgi:hypothetical protein